MRVNGSDVPDPAADATTLLEHLRETLGATGSKEGCGVGECGACTVLIDGIPAFACTALAARLTESEIETVEGLSEESASLRSLLVERGAIQCGFCTPGIVVATIAARRAGISADEASIRHALGGNVCRCTGYAAIVEAVREFLAESVDLSSVRA